MGVIMERFAQSLLDRLLREKRDAARYAEGRTPRGVPTPALAQGFIERQKAAEAQGERETEIQERKDTAEMGRKKLKEAGALERTRMMEEGQTGRTRMTEAGATSRAGMQTQGLMDLEKMKQEGGASMQAWVANAPAFMAALMQNPMMDPESVQQAMGMYWEQAAAATVDPEQFAPPPPSGPAQVRMPMPQRTGRATAGATSPRTTPAEEMATPFAPRQAVRLRDIGKEGVPPDMAWGGLVSREGLREFGSGFKTGLTEFWPWFGKELARDARQKIGAIPLGTRPATPAPKEEDQLRRGY